MVFSAGPLVKAGYFSKTQGFNGKLKVTLESGVQINLKEPFFLYMQERPVPFFFSEAERDQVMVDGYETYEKARELVGREWFVAGDPNQATGKLNLVGYEIIDRQLGEIGVISSQWNSGFQELVVVQYRGNDCMIPLVEAIFPNIDHQLKVVHADLPEGLLNLSDADTEEE